jgi:hypothetical protein
MAENQLIHRNNRIRAEARDTDWATLIARAVDDITRIVDSEFRLLSASMKTVLDEEIDRVLAFVATGVLMVGGVICVLAAVIGFLHEYAMLPWWQSFGICGLTLFALAIALGAYAARRPRPPAITSV